MPAWRRQREIRPFAVAWRVVSVLVFRASVINGLCEQGNL
jgi:hypothetical protein